MRSSGVPFGEVHHGGLHQYEPLEETEWSSTSSASAFRVLEGQGALGGRRR
jgi:hypothetical protein